MLLAPSHPPLIRRPDLALTWGFVAAAWLLSALLVIDGGDYIVDHDAVLGNRQFAWPLTLLLFIASWQLMTAAMMLPSSLPMVVMYSRVARNHPRPRLMFGLFLFGYFVVWSGFAVVALGNDVVVHRFVDRVAIIGERPWIIGGAILVMAGAFQFSSLKERCLDACRDPLAFFWGHYRPGARSAVRLGIRHGLFCLGCCWALMLTMFAVGMGSLAWMTALAGVMLIEKTSIYGKRMARPIGVILIAWGLLVMLHLDWLPAFVRGG